MEKIDNLDKQILEIISRMLVFHLKTLPLIAEFLAQPFTNVYSD